MAVETTLIEETDPKKGTLQDAINKAAQRGVDAVLKFISGEPDNKLAPQAEKMLSSVPASEDDKDAIRSSIKSLPVEAQSTWISSFLASTTRGLKKEASESLAWTLIKKSYRQEGDSWKTFQGANVIASESGNNAGFAVYHRSLSDVFHFAKQEDASHFAISIMKAAGELPEVSYDEASQTFKVQHKDVTAPIETKSSEEARGLVEAHLKKAGLDSASIEGYIKSLAAFEHVQATATKENTGMEVTAETKQVEKGTPDKQSVSGLPTYDKAKQHHQQGEVTGTGGFVSTEKPAVDAVPTVKPGPHSMKQTHTGDYASLANQSDAEIMKLQRSKGLMETNVPKTISASVDQMSAIVDAAIRLSATVGAEKTLALLKEAASKEAQDWISHKIAKLRDEGKPEDQASAIAYSMAREHGFDVPEKK